MRASERGLTIQDLHCRLGKRLILRGLTASPLKAGEFVAVLGRNGVGKSTLLRCIAGVIPCTAARMSLNGVDLRQLSAAARSGSIRYLPQAAPHDLHLTVRESLLVALNASRRHVAGAAQQRIEHTTESLGIANLLEYYLDELSGGQKQLVWLAQALVHQPSVLLLDEPLAALDPNYQHHVMQLLQRLASEEQLTIVTVLHDLNMAMRYTDQVLILHDGAILAQGPTVPTLTAQTLAQAFLVAARIEHHGGGRPVIIIDDLLTL